MDCFAARGGKLLLAPGAADALVSTRTTEDYYERLVNRYGNGAKGVKRLDSDTRPAHFGRVGIH